jgi:hypothetical protein
MRGKPTSIIMWYVNSLYAAGCSNFNRVYIYRNKRVRFVSIPLQRMFTYISSSICNKIFLLFTVLLYDQQTFLRLQFTRPLFLTSICKLYVFFWVIPRRLNFLCQRFGTVKVGK